MSYHLHPSANSMLLFNIILSLFVHISLNSSTNHLKMCLTKPLSLANKSRFESYNSLDDDVVWNDNCTYVDYDKYMSISNSCNELQLIQLNIRGLVNKQAELSKLLYREHSNKVDVALLCETWIRSENLHRVKIAGYNLESKERKGKKGGGVSILIKDSIKHPRHKDLESESSHLECITVEIQGNNENILLTS